MSSAKVPKSGRFTARAGFALGIIATLAGNVGHALIPTDAWIEAQAQAAKINPNHTPESWTPPLGSLIMASFWPVALVICVEVLARVDWGKDRKEIIMPVGFTALVGLIAAIISYRHLYELMSYYGEADLAPYIGPLAVDGLMAVCTIAMLRVAANVRSAELTQRRAEQEAAHRAAEAAAAQLAQERAAQEAARVEREMVQTLERAERRRAEQLVQKPAPVERPAVAPVEQPVAQKPAPVERPVVQEVEQPVAQKRPRGGTAPELLDQAVALVRVGGKSQRQAEEITGVDRRKIKAELARLEKLAEPEQKSSVIPFPASANGHTHLELVKQN